jgi:hypothetical protein
MFSFIYINMTIFLICESIIYSYLRLAYLFRYIYPLLNLPFTLNYSHIMYIHIIYFTYWYS